MSDPIQIDADLFELLTTLPVSDARALLGRFEQKGIRFQLAPEESQLQGMNPHAASTGGSFGVVTQIMIFTHRDDAESVERIWRPFCGLEN